MSSGMLACAYGSGAVLWAPIAMFFMKRYGVLSVFGILAAIFAIVMIPTSFLIKEVPEDFRQKVSQGQEKKHHLVTVDYTWQEMLKTSRYYILVLALTLAATAGLMITGHASSMLQEMQHVTAEQAAFIVGLFSVFNALGRLFFGYISDRVGRYEIMLLLFVIIGGSMLLLTKSMGPMFIILLMAISACYGGFTSMFSPICADNFGLKNLSVNYGFLYIAYGLAGIIGPQLAARVRVMSGGYNMAFLVVAGMSVVGFMLILSLKRGKKQSIS